MDKEKHVDEAWKDSASQESQGASSVSDQSQIIIDESWKDSAEQDNAAESKQPEQSQPAQPEVTGDEQPIEVNFITYISSLAFQSLIFLGEVPNPMTNKVEKNLMQAKFLIDTLVMMREKTTGNLSEQESNLLNGTIYELQMKYVEQSKEGQQPEEGSS